MKKRGFTLIELLVVIAIIAMLLAILMPALNKVKKIAQRVVCGTNLKGLGTAQVVYANDYDDAYAIQGGGGVAQWNYAMDGGFANASLNISTKLQITVGSSLYLLVREADVSPKSFICGAGGQTAYEGENASQLDITELWDFGIYSTATIASPDTGVGNIHGPKNHVSYSYQMPYADGGGAGRYAADGTKSAAFAVMSDKNPWYDPKLMDVSTAGSFTGDNAADIVRLMGPYYRANLQKYIIQSGNTYGHSREGQNVLFGDGHSSYEKTSDVGVKHDNIYTIAYAAGNNEDPHRRGTDGDGGTFYIIDGARQPFSSNDSFLVNDDNKNL